MLETLTQEQEEMMVKVRDEWIDFALNSGKQPTREELQPIVNWYYSKFSHKKPTLCICESPMSMQLAINIMQNPEFWKRINKIAKSTLSAKKILGQSVWQSVEQSVWQSVEQSVWQSVRQSV
ncbi:MAG: hypothetical protein KGH64_00715, partial [Candidatus Micrarchaeota archaeon]|nr:hypothetical protein [Candidatus Micrarchaeota archaeon]